MTERPRLPDRRSAAVAALALCVAAPSVAEAVDCATLPSPVYGIGGSAQKPLLARFAARLAALTSPVTVIYQSPGACFGINAFVDPTARINGSASYWGADGREQSCDLPLAGQPADFGVMGNGASLCPGVAGVPEGVGDFEGPVSSYAFIVPTASTQRSISAEAAYFVYGFGREGNVAPWTDEAQLIRRDANSAAQIFMGLAVGLSPERFVGVDAMTNGRSVSLVAMSTNPEAAIGFVSGEVADANRATVRALAYQHARQSCGYWPDSTATAFDKRNVRDGHYWIWSATHLFARVGADRLPTSARVATLFGHLTGATPPSDAVPSLDLTIQSGNIPRCAMRVGRSGDLGPLFSYAPPEPCGCYFERVATGSTACAACATNTDCPSTAPACRHGYCEAN